LAFDEATFQKLLIRWIVYDNVSFRQVDSEPFHDLLAYLSPRAKDAIPSGKTAKDWIMKGYNIHKAKIKQELQQNPHILRPLDFWQLPLAQRHRCSLYQCGISVENDPTSNSRAN
jgi:hypothetical protein